MSKGLQEQGLTEADLQVVTTARSVSCARHFNELHRKEKSMVKFDNERDTAAVISSKVSHLSH